MGPLSIPVIMCGGAGTRVWPESREMLPKQFIPLVGERSTFQRVVSLLDDGRVFDKPIVITNRDYRFLVAEQLAELGVDGNDRARAGAARFRTGRRRGGGACRAAGARHHRRDVCGGPHLREAGGVSGQRREAAARLRPRAISSASASSLRILRPISAISARARRSRERDARKVDAFVEKPDAETAERYIAEGYLWNSGNFVFPAELMRTEIARFEPEMAAAVEEAVAKAKPDLNFLVLDDASFARATKKSIDYAVMERTDRAAVLPADMGWSDLGTWSSALSYLHGRMRPGTRCAAMASCSIAGTSTCARRRC